MVRFPSSRLHYCWFVPFFCGCSERKNTDPTGARIKGGNGQMIVTDNPSKACQSCHEDIYKAWKESDHHHANRLFALEDWRQAFEPRKYVAQGGDVSTFYLDPDSGKAVIETLGSDGNVHGFTPDMVLAHRPLVQFLIPFPDGRWQTTELAWDVNQGEWFNVYGDEHRRSDEWGHWSQRGMNWNAQCAVCHTSFYSKNYDVTSDAYTSHWDEMGISCQQCHGKMPEHLSNPEAALVVAEKVSDGAYFESCFSCHSRREDITGNFRVGDRFIDHHRLQLPVDERYYFPDGQKQG